MIDAINAKGSNAQRTIEAPAALIRIAGV